MGIRSVLLLCVFHCFSVDGQVSDPLPADFLLIVDGIMYRTDITNYSYVTIPLQDNFVPNDIDYDPTDSVIFAANRSHIISLSIYGERQTTVRAFNEEANIIGIAVDATSRLLFYTDTGNDVIGVISLDNNSQKTVLRNVERPGDIVADPINGNLYWSERGSSLLILEMSKYDGTNRTQLVQNRTEVPSVIYTDPMMDLDFKDGDLYLCKNEHTRIRRVNARGSNEQIPYENEEEDQDCSITVDQSNIYFIFGSEIKRLGTDGTGETTFPSDDLTYPTAIHSHSNRSRATNGCSGGRSGCSHFCFPLPAGSRMCSCPDFMTLRPDHQTCEGYSSPQGIAVDVASRLLFYTDKESGIIAVLSLDGSLQKVIVRSKFEEPDAIATNPVNGTIFWTNFGTNGMIETANYDGTNKRELINTGGAEPSDLAIDITEGALYWCIAGGIYKVDVNGMNRQLIYKENKATFQRIAFYQSNLYFTSPSHRNVMKRRREGGKPTPFGPATSGYIVDLHVFKGSDTKDRNGCSNASGTCSHFCFPRPGGLKMCACPDDMSLQGDGRTCQTRSERLNVLQAAVGSLACLFAISVLLNVCFVRKKKRMQTEDTKSKHYATLVSREEEGGENQTAPDAINNGSL